MLNNICAKSRNMQGKTLKLIEEWKSRKKVGEDKRVC